MLCVIMPRTSHSVDLNKTQSEELKVLCATCRNTTNHVVVVSVDSSDTEDDGDERFRTEDNFQILQCRGCDAYTFRHLNWFSELDDAMSGTDGNTERLYPKRNARTIPVADSFNVPVAIQRIYRESIDACNNEYFTLAAGGLRALVEGICADQSIADGPVPDPNGGAPRRKNTLEGKINGLVEKGILTQKNAETLHEHRILGNEALHELESPRYGELKLAIEIIQHVIEELYEIPAKGQELRQHRTKREARP
jgi:hypothetical protein